MERPVSDEFAYATATELATRIRRRDLSPVELLDAVIARIEARNPSLNALVFTAFDEARERAREAERELTSGEDLGPLHGVPTATKDLFDFKPGWPATFGGIRALADFSVPAHCTYAERMEAAGAILIGKTNSPVMGFRGTCDNYLFGPSRTPSTRARTLAAPPVAAPPQSPTGCCRWPREPTEAGPSASPPRGAACTDTRPPSAACPTPPGRTRSRLSTRSSSRAP
jgi:hypothetical protein